MRILFDHQAFELQRWGGISRYFLELISGLSSLVEVELALARAMNEHVPALERLLGIRVSDRGFAETFLPGKRFPGKKQLRSVVKRVNRSFDARGVNRRASRDCVRRGAFDLFHPTYYDPYFLDALAGRPFVVTVHDLVHEVYPEHFPPDDRIRAWKRIAVRAAARIIAVSEHTKRDLVRLLGVDPERVDVVHHGFSAAELAGAPPPGLPRRYVLFTGTRASYKNWRFCVRALDPLLRAEGLALVCTGEPFTAHEREFLERGVGARVLHVRAARAQMLPLYAGAAAFVFPSLYEGFGFPVLEAFAAGCPAALARTSSLPEIGGDAALYFDPTDAEALRVAVASLLRDGALRGELVARGRERVREFTWGNACARTIATYERALGGAGLRASSSA